MCYVCYMNSYYSSEKEANSVGLLGVQAIMQMQLWKK